MSQRATFTPLLARSATEAMRFGLPGGVAISTRLATKTVGAAALPACTTAVMLPGAAEANTSAGAPWSIWVASVELASKLNVIFVPACAAWNCLPIVLNASVSEAAA